MDLRIGRVLPSFAKSMYDEMIDNITSNTSHYYAFAALMNRNADGLEITDNNDYNNNFIPTWQILFGKKLTNTDISPVVYKNMWQKDKIYDKYDNLNINLHANANFYVFSPPAVTGAPYHIYKCIDNANGAVSTVRPSILQATTFQTPDGYKWRYITSVSYKDFQNYSTLNYAPIHSNSSITDLAAINSGVEVVVVANGGSNYSTYHNGTIRSVTSSTLLQIGDDAIVSNDHYTNSAVYIYTEGSATSQFADISKYNANTSGKWITLKSAVDLNHINPGVTKYKISPKVVFDTDGATDPVAYSVVNATTNTIHSIVVTNIGSHINWANVSLQCNTSHGSGANLYAIVPPPGGHGSDPASELDMKGVSVHFSFSNTELGTYSNGSLSFIPTNGLEYDTVGIIKNPYEMVKITNTLGEIISNSKTTKSGNRFWSKTFDQTTHVKITTGTFNVGDKIKGSTSGAIGQILVANSSYLHIIGDKYFVNNEIITTPGGVSASANIVHHSDVYSKDIVPLYVQYINTIDRPISNTQTESFNLLLQF